MSNVPPDDRDLPADYPVDIDPDLVERVNAVLNEVSKLANVEAPARAWVMSRLEDLIRKYQMPAAEWLARVVGSGQSWDPADEEASMYIFVAAGMLYQSLPKSLTKSKMLDMIRGFMSLGWQLRDDQLTGRLYGTEPDDNPSAD